MRAAVLSTSDQPMGKPQPRSVRRTDTTKASLWLSIHPFHRTARSAVGSFKAVRSIGFSNSSIVFGHCGCVFHDSRGIVCAILCVGNESRTQGIVSRGPDFAEMIVFLRLDEDSLRFMPIKPIPSMPIFTITSSLLPGAPSSCRVPEDPCACEGNRPAPRRGCRRLAHSR
jgi:hypothetical protein